MPRSTNPPSAPLARALEAFDARTGYRERGMKPPRQTVLTLLAVWSEGGEDEGIGVGALVG